MVCDDTATAMLRSSPTQPHSSRRRSSVMGQRLAASPHEPLWPVPLWPAAPLCCPPLGPSTVLLQGALSFRHKSLWFDGDGSVAMRTRFVRASGTSGEHGPSRDVLHPFVVCPFGEMSCAASAHELSHGGCSPITSGRPRRRRIRPLLRSLSHLSLPTSRADDRAGPGRAGPGRAGPAVLIACPKSLSPCASHCLYWEYPHYRLTRRRRCRVAAPGGGATQRSKHGWTTEGLPVCPLTQNVSGTARRLQGRA
jgi:hypothetical protein